MGHLIQRMLVKNSSSMYANYERVVLCDDALFQNLDPRSQRHLSTQGVEIGAACLPFDHDHNNLIMYLTYHTDLCKKNVKSTDKIISVFIQ